MSGALLVCGTASDAGKSVVVTGLCRWLARQGVEVAPFKAQNMALNAAVTADGGEIGRAQAAQAAAAGVPAEVAMNPILIKPTGERHSQVVVMGRPAFDAGARNYAARKAELLPVVLDALADLRSRYDAVICEGAGGAAEINLRAADLSNLGLARAADLPVLVVADIDRGGTFAALHGTLALLDADDQRHVAGFVVNRFRGDRAVLEPGLRQLERLTGRPSFGVLPHVDGLMLDAEDSLDLERRAVVETPPVGRDTLDVAVIGLPRISNFTDTDALAAEPGVAVRFTRSVRDVERADLVVLPGTKATVDDLAWLRERGLADAVVRRAGAGLPLLATCGGYQMLGEVLDDRVESGAGRVAGLGLLPVATTFAPDKILARPTGTSPLFGDVEAGGYEIRHGRVTRHGGQPWLRDAAGLDEGCVVGETLATSWHGLCEHDALRRALLSHVAAVTGREWLPGARPFAEVREQRMDTLADLVADHLDTAAVTRLLADGAPDGLPVVPPAGPTPAAVAAGSGALVADRFPPRGGIGTDDDSSRRGQRRDSSRLEAALVPDAPPMGGELE